LPAKAAFAPHAGVAVFDNFFSLCAAYTDDFQCQYSGNFKKIIFNIHEIKNSDNVVRHYQLFSA